MGKKLQLESIDPSVSAQEFFAKYVSKRRPVVLKGLPDDSAFKGRKWTDLSYLAKKAGHVEVMVEPIHPTANQYGTDVERVPMPFGDFLESLKSGEKPHPYLTTQYSEEDPDSETVFPPPTNALRDEFPVVPRIMGNLFLQQVNLWLGKSKDGSSSGLHHDFHDNLYVLLQGRKRFILFPPKEVKHLYPHGTLDTHHPNGLIAYEDIPVRADGLSKRAACRARVGALERQIDALKKAERKGEKSKHKNKGKDKGKGKTQSKEMKALMEAHDAALDELAMFALEEGGGEDEVDDFDALMAGLEDEAEDGGGPGPSRIAKGTDSEEEDDEEEWKGIGYTGDAAAVDSDDEDANDDNDEDTDEDEDEDDPMIPDPPSEPSSFSRIPTAHLHHHLGLPTTAVLPPSFSPSDFPFFEKAKAPYVVELSAGEMLYLPASWWHEVTSTSTSTPGTGSRGGGVDDVHMAFNYWFYPPDAPERFEAPYRDELVWGYLRSKAAREGNVGEGAKDGEDTAKRARKVGGEPEVKRAKR